MRTKRKPWCGRSAPNSWCIPPSRKKILYPACQGKIKDEELVDEAYVEHDGAKVLIAELVQGSPADEFYDAKVKVLSELIKHHVKEEERPSDGLFAEVRAAGADVEELGARLSARKEELLAEFKDGAKLPPPETRSYKGHKLKQNVPVEAPAV